MKLPQETALKSALKLPNGARFYRCALQVNPFKYLIKQGRQTTYRSEEEYNHAIVKKCKNLNIEVIAVTDHYCIQDSIKLLNYARKSGLKAFGGFEAVTKDGVHFLCLFNESVDEARDIERFIGKCGVSKNNISSPIGELYSTQLIENSRDWKSVCIAAHIFSNGGLFKKLTGQSRASVWKHPNLLACAIPGPVRDVPVKYNSIIENKNSEYWRQNLPAFLNANDVNSPDDLDIESTSCFIKMSEVTIEALRQAFLDPGSRIRLNYTPPEYHSKLMAMNWAGGFLNDTAVHFNDNLNILVGGRGTGKSTMIESIRYILGLSPIGEDAKKAHEGIIKNVLKSGTRLSLLVSTRKPSQQTYIIERTVPNPPVVKDDRGEVLNLLPSDVMPGVEVFGQHEISELTKSPEKLTQLLERFVDNHPSKLNNKIEIRMGLERSRNRIVNVQNEIINLEEQLSALPGLEEKLKRFKKVGLEKSLEQKSLLIREENILSNIEVRLKQYREIQINLSEILPVDTAFVSEKALQGLPNAEILGEIQDILKRLSSKLKESNETFKEVLLEADKSIEGTKLLWDNSRKSIEENYVQVLRDLQESNIDGEEFIRLSKHIEHLRPLKQRLEILNQKLELEQNKRRNLLSDWEDIKADEFRAIDDASKRVSNLLQGRVKVRVEMAGNREPLFELLREVGGNLKAPIERLKSRDQLSLQDLAQSCREGKNSLITNYGLPPGAADRIAGAHQDFFMRIEELELTSTTQIELNTAPDNKPSHWQDLQSLSTGQKATAVLLLLLLESEAPLIVDQPEDDLDNRFITEGVVPIIRREKIRRQIIFSTHNANIPVLGDAEIIFGFSTFGDSREQQSKIPLEHMGSIDTQPVRELVEEILEGGKAAFEMRRSKYGF